MSLSRNVTGRESQRHGPASYDGCAMDVVFSCLWNCLVCMDDDFRDEGREFQHVGPETAKAREPNVTIPYHTIVLFQATRPISTIESNEKTRRQKISKPTEKRR